MVKPYTRIKKPIPVKNPVSGPEPKATTQYSGAIGPVKTTPKPKATTQYSKPIGPQEPRGQRAIRLAKRGFEGGKKAYTEVVTGIQGVASHLPRSQFEDVYPHEGNENFGFNFGDFGGQRDYDWGFNLPITGGRRKRDDDSDRKTVIVIQGGKAKVKKKSAPKKRGSNLPDFGFKFKGF